MPNHAESRYAPSLYSALSKKNPAEFSEVIYLQCLTTIQEKGMHNYLSAIGLKNIFTRESEIERMLDNFPGNCDSRQAAREEIPGCAFLEMCKSFGPGMGIRLCGQMDDQGFHRMYYYPYLERNSTSVVHEVSVEKRSSGNGYYGITDDGRAGMNIIFFLQNPAEFMKNSFREILREKKVPVALTGLSNSGKILLGHRQARDEEKILRKNDDSERTALISAARDGDEDAVQSLTMEEIDIYSMLSRRIQTEDLYTIVESSFIPGGTECNLYRIIGTILFYTKVQNTLTRQYVYQMTIDCNGIPVDIAINAGDLLGDPDVGRRFKGTIWLQGSLRFKGEQQPSFAVEQAAADEI